MLSALSFDYLDSVLYSAIRIPKFFCLPITPSPYLRVSSSSFTWSGPTLLWMTPISK
jgi:hypothetical protein